MLTPSTVMMVTITFCTVMVYKLAVYKTSSELEENASCYTIPVVTGVVVNCIDFSALLPKSLLAELYAACR